MKIAFIWQESSNKNVFNHWNDGLRLAMRYIEKEHTVTYHEPWDDVSFADIILYWEAPCTARGKNAEHYNKIRHSNQKKIMLFAGGPIDLLDAVGFDLYLVESELNEKEFEDIGLPWKRAFGINDEIFTPQNTQKKFDAFYQATFAEWKRHTLFAKALGDRGHVSGRLQENDRQGYYDCQAHGVVISPELDYKDVAQAINEAYTVVNTASYWGGGQRCTLEAMACNVPVIVMNDSPKNMEYVEESGAGIIVEPTSEAIRDAIENAKIMQCKGRKYIESKYTGRHYAYNILQAIKEVCG